LGLIDLDILRNLQETAVKAAGLESVRIIQLPDEPPGTYGVVKQDGELEVRTVGARPRSHNVVSLDDFTEAVMHYKEKWFEPAVWYSTAAIVAVLDDKPGSRRLDRITLPLKFTPPFAWFAEKAERDWLPQKAFIRKLRIDLGECLTDSSSALLASARIITFKSSEGGFGRVQQGQESLGRDIEEAVSVDQGPLPDAVTFNVRVFTDAGLTRAHSLGCALDVNAKEVTFNLAPTGDAIQTILDDELTFISNQLEGALTDVPVFGGTP
jgi:hypothetical protein